MRKKKTITYEGIEYFYEIVHNTLDSGTYVYDTTPKITYVKKYWLFGPLLKIVSYDYLFQIWDDIENPNFSKEDIKNKFKYKVELLNRQKEIESGNIL